MGYYCSNYGWIEVECEEDLEWYNHVQSMSVEKTCKVCKKKVMLLPKYVTCDSCMRAMGHP
jgi:hypothetical protein